MLLLSVNCVAHCVIDKASNVCVTAGCVNAAADVLDLMDPTVGPCEDFYNFACGQFLNRTVLSDEKVSIDTFSISRDHMQSQLYQLIDAPIQPNESRFVWWLPLTNHFYLLPIVIFLIFPDFPFYSPKIR